MGAALLGTALNALLVVPVYMLVRRIARPRPFADRPLDPSAVDA
jgi:asparagine N-glycosylation enzyme membrane subunit Stt3